MLREFFNGTCALIFPRNCTLCRNILPAGQNACALCWTCRAVMTLNTPPFCRKCSRRLTDMEHPLCAACRAHPPLFDRGWAVCRYTPPVRRMIHLFKYGHKTGLRHHFLDMAGYFIKTHRLDMGRFDLVIPVPLHSARLRERGYNQAALLSEPLARRFGIPHSGNLIRTRHTRNQALLTKKERWTNIHAAFKITFPLQIEGKSILVVDDLMTTGATLSEAARTLKEARAAEVTALTIAVAG